MSEIKTASHDAPLPTGIGTGWVQPEEQEDEDSLWLRWPVDELLTVRIVSPEPNHYRGHWVPAVKAYRRCTTPRCPYCPLPVAEQPPGRAAASEARWRHLLAVELLGGRSASGSSRRRWRRVCRC